MPSEVLKHITYKFTKRNTHQLNVFSYFLVSAQVVTIAFTLTISSLDSRRFNCFDETSLIPSNRMRLCPIRSKIENLSIVDSSSIVLQQIVYLAYFVINCICCYAQVFGVWFLENSVTFFLLIDVPYNCSILTCWCGRNSHRSFNRPVLVICENV